MIWFLSGFTVAVLFASTAGAADGPKPIADSKLVEFATKRARQVQPVARERRIDEIGWAQSLTAAKMLAAVEKRPVFLFTHDGKVSTGRC